MPCLRSFSFHSRNQLSSLPPYICQLPLRVLIVSNNKLGALPPDISTLGSLRQLVRIKGMGQKRDYCARLRELLGGELEKGRKHPWEKRLGLKASSQREIAEQFLLILDL